MSYQQEWARNGKKQTLLINSFMVNKMAHCITWDGIAVWSQSLVRPVGRNHAPGHATEPSDQTTLTTNVQEKPQSQNTAYVWHQKEEKTKKKQKPKEEEEEEEEEKKRTTEKTKRAATRTT